MTKSYSHTSVPFFVIILLGAGFLLYSCTPKKTVHLETFRTESGWGYVLKKDTHVFIKQEVIPTVSGNQSFQTKKEAEKVGLLVLKKIKQRKSPTMSKAELDSLNIHYQ